MSAMRTGILLCLLLKDSLLASPGGILTGTVRSALTGVPLMGARVALEGAELRTETNRDGGYTIPQVTEATWTATASYTYHSGPEEHVPFITISKSFRAAGGCTTRLDFHLFGAEKAFWKDPPDAESLLRRILNPDTICADTIAWFQSSHDDSVRQRCNAVKLGLLRNLKAGRSARAAVMSPYPQGGGCKWVLTYRRSCFLHFRDPSSWGMFTRGDPEYFQVKSVDVGYFSENGNGPLKYVKCQAPYPSDRWLVLKLNLPGGPSLYF
jgi:hypothetical protein